LTDGKYPLAVGIIQEVSTAPFMCCEGQKIFVISLGRLARRYFIAMPALEPEKIAEGAKEQKRGNSEIFS